MMLVGIRQAFQSIRLTQLIAGQLNWFDPDSGEVVVYNGEYFLDLITATAV